jgi:hypothetical protein
MRHYLSIYRERGPALQTSALFLVPHICLEIFDLFFFTDEPAILIWNCESCTKQLKTVGGISLAPTDLICSFNVLSSRYTWQSNKSSQVTTLQSF